jgi:hypothetical protein
LGLPLQILTRKKYAPIEGCTYEQYKHVVCYVCIDVSDFEKIASELTLPASYLVRAVSYNVGLSSQFVPFSSRPSTDGSS